MKNSTLPVFIGIVLSLPPGMTHATIIIDSKKDLSRVNNNHFMPFFPNGISADGLVVIGEADINDTPRAVLWTAPGGITKLDISPHSPYSITSAVSATGNVVVGSFSPTGGALKAFRWTPQTGMQPLDFLSDKISSSSAQGVSADGSVIVGTLVLTNGNHQAFRWTEHGNVTTLGSIKRDSSGFSMTNGISADGQVVVGMASIDTQNDGDYFQAFRWTQHEGMKGLGSLRSDGTGISSADAVSADGSVVVGSAITDSNHVQAFRWTEKEGMQNLGTLKAESSGSSTARSVSANGLVVVGDAQTDSQQPQEQTDSTEISEMQFFAQQPDTQAFYWTTKSGMQNLGSLRSDNRGFSSAYGVSADGSVVVGHAENNQGELHAILWKIKEKDIVAIDAVRSSTAMVQTGQRGFKVLDLYQNSLNLLIQSRCQLGDQDDCIGLFSQSSSLNRNKRIATGIFATTRLPVENWRVGAAVNFAHQTSLIDNYAIRGSTTPGLGSFLGYQQHRDGSGFNAELSVAWLQQPLTITRDRLENSEAGKGNATLKGYQTRLSIGLGLPLNTSTLLTPEAAISYTDIYRSAYSENRDAEFAARYGKMGHQRTAAQLGLNARHRLTESISLDGRMGLKVKLKEQAHDFTGAIPYIGAVACHRSRQRDSTAYMNLGLNIAVTADTLIRASAGRQHSDYQNNTTQMELSYSWQW